MIVLQRIGFTLGREQAFKEQVHARTGRGGVRQELQSPVRYVYLDPLNPFDFFCVLISNQCRIFVAFSWSSNWCFVFSSIHSFFAFPWSVNCLGTESGKNYPVIVGGKIPDALVECKDSLQLPPLFKEDLAQVHCCTMMKHIDTHGHGYMIEHIPRMKMTDAKDELARWASAAHQLFPSIFM